MDNDELVEGVRVVLHQVLSLGKS